MSIKEQEAPRIDFKPYLIHPIKEKIVIAEGYLYSREERALHGAYWHKGIDYSATYGIPIYASAAGYAVASYHRMIVLNRDNTLKLFHGKPMANGFGYVVQIYHPEKICGIPGGRITQYAHLSAVTDIQVKMTKPIMLDHSERIRRINKSLSPKQLEEKIRKNKDMVRRYPWVNKAYGYSFTDDLETMESYTYTPDELELLHKKGNPEVKWVEQGQKIGELGTSAVWAGMPNYKEGNVDPHIPEPDNNWDELHLHFEEALRDPVTRLKLQRRDPYDIYKSFIWYKPRYIKRTLFVDNPF